jgi:predicted ATP-grasp superfamily ATP-dependent carboligase
MPTRRLLIVEYLCAGFASLQGVSQSMLSEGRAMLLALLQDAARIDGLHVSTLWNTQLGDPSLDAIAALSTSSPFTAQQAWNHALNNTDAVYVIAPETGGILKRMCTDAERTGADVLNCSPAAIDLAGDKWKTWRTLNGVGIATIPTQLLRDYLTIPAFDRPPTGLVIKPRDGCGSEGIRMVHDDSLSPATCPPTPPELTSGGKGWSDGRNVDAASGLQLPEPDDWIVQPYIAGRPTSIAVLYDDRGRPRDVFPLAIQHLSADLKYQGGRIPADSDQPQPDARQLRSLATRIGEAFPGLRGYVGIDLLLQTDGSCVIVEINPRLTTSYIGYRALAADNLAQHWLMSGAGECDPIAWRPGSVTFTAAGEMS